MSHPEWLQEALEDYEDDYILFDLPGQIELFSHIDVMVRLVKLLENMGYVLDLMQVESLGLHPGIACVQCIYWTATS